MDRRRFLNASLMFGAGIGLSSVATRSLTSATALSPQEKEVVITILHTNDTHSQIEPLPSTDRLYPGKGGVARRATLVKRVRQENPNTLMIDAGDVFQGTPYFNFYKGEVDYKAMSAIGYDVGTLGNHEFDNGVDALAAAVKFAKFDLVSVSYDVKGTPLEEKIKPYVVRELSGVRVGLFGLSVSPVGLITPANFKGVTYREPIAAAREVVATLRGKEKCSLVVAMSHLGYYPEPQGNQVGDSQVAAAVDGIDFIASGHTHTFMKEPVKVKQPGGNETLIFQVGRSGIFVGRVDITMMSGKVVATRGRLLDLRDPTLG